MGLLGNEPEECGVKKVEAVDGAEDPQREIESPLQLSFSSPFAEETLILQILDHLTENTHANPPYSKTSLNQSD